MIIKINSKEELLNGEVILNCEEAIETREKGRFYLKNENFPKYFKYCPPFDYGFNATYNEVEKVEYLEQLENELKEAEAKVKKLKKRLAYELEG